MDDVAERIRAIVHYAPATLKQYLLSTSLTEQSRETNNSSGLITELLENHQSIIIHLRENINTFANEYLDLGMSDFVTGLMKTHEKMAWMLKAHLT
jgi:starvation-inducible DNA-binding protein